jgi:hypothetical protein
MEKIDTTFQEVYKLLEENGWKRIEVDEYILEKRDRKHHTARIGLYGFFKLKKSNKQIKEEQ